jgi:DNA-binding NtrC family response regulator/tetratricopeptide (TPR) repeat protein
MALSFHDADRLFRNGDFSELLRLVGLTPGLESEWDPRTRVVIAHAFAITGNLATAQSLATLDTAPSSAPVVRARAESVLGIVNQMRGDVDSARRHFHSAIRHAQDSKDPERIAWTHLHLYRLLVEGHPMDALTAMLSQVRKLVTRAGDAQVTAYLHSSVAVLEGQTGRLNEAVRHCDIAESLLRLAPNTWLSGNVFLIRACIACLACQFDLAAECIAAARELTAKSGHVFGTASWEANLGHVETMRGRFDKANAAFRRVLESTGRSAFAVLAASESFARLCLSVGDLEGCQRALNRIEEESAKHEGLRSVYHVRWAGITNARLLLKRGQPDAALVALRHLEEQSKSIRDLPFSAAINLNAALALSRTDQHRLAAQRLLSSDRFEVTGHRDLQPQFYYGAGQAIAGKNISLMKQMRDRALRVWSEQGVVSVQMEMEAPSSDVSSEAPQSTEHQIAPDNRAPTIVNSLATAFDVAYSPSLLGIELLETIKNLACASDAKIAETRSEGPSKADGDVTFSVSLGPHGRKNLTLVCKPPEHPAEAVLLADVLRIGRAAIALERARQEERGRAAIWPATPAEEQAGALFLAEEMQTLFATARRVAPTSVPVLITGETGTGKEVLARMIHAYSNRAAKPFLPFNCSATPKEMLDSQLFGHRRGSFTGALENFSGIIRAAAAGTLFLDEIGETTLDVQPKLLRFLESGEVHPIGETQPLKVDVRVIAATNADLETLLATGRFREDLFYRLNIVRLHVPPLRERRVEIPALAHHYLQRHGQECGKGDLRLSEETMEYLVLYRWPGNVRQLANEMRRLAALAEPGAVLMPEHLSAEIAASRRTIPASQRMLDSTELVVRLDQPMAAAVQHLERAMVQYALNRCKGRIEETATMLGLSRKGLYLKRQRFGLEPPGNRPAEVA